MKKRFPKFPKQSQIRTFFVLALIVSACRILVVELPAGSEIVIRGGTVFKGDSLNFHYKRFPNGTHFTIQGDTLQPSLVDQH